MGWTTSSNELIQGLIRIRQFTTFCGAAPLQEAAATALLMADDEGYYAQLTASYAQKRSIVVDALNEVGLSVLAPQGAFYVIVDVAELDFESGDAFCRHLTKEVGVTAVPCHAFYQNPEDGKHLVRFAFCKTDETLHEAANRLRKLK